MNRNGVEKYALICIACRKEIIKTMQKGTGEISPKSRALTASPEDLGYIPKCHRTTEYSSI